MLQLRACYGETGACTHEKILKNKAIWWILYLNQTLMKFTTNDSATRKQ